MLVDGFARSRVLCQRRRIRVMSGEPVGRQSLGRPVVFRVEDRRLLPEATLHLQDRMPLSDAHIPGVAPALIGWRYRR